jgi:hypothetical protein
MDWDPFGINITGDLNNLSEFLKYLIDSFEEFQTIMEENMKGFKGSGIHVFVPVASKPINLIM